MKLSREAKRLARQLFDATLVHGRLDESRSLIVAETLVTKKPRHGFEILKEFTRLTRLHLSAYQAVVESATPLEPSLQAEITAVLQSRNNQVNITTVVNPALLGGTRIRLGSDVWDGSVSAKLQNLKKF
ncbi:MAG: F0F1 ATP synthase subunit delta [Chthoniobacterales bacterium]|nr:F0F1 ATP synthase subunit delta [Chthoniobacterales bacterium]